MEHLAQDLSIALEESESCGPIALETRGKWGMRRRTRSAGNLHTYLKSGDDDSSSSHSESRNHFKSKDERMIDTVHHSDSDDVSFSIPLPQGISRGTHLLKLKHPLHRVIRGRYKKLGMSHSLESDSFNEHSPARPNIRRKRKLKRMSIDETPIPPVGKRKRPQRIDILENARSQKCNLKIKPLHPSIVDKIERYCPPMECDRMDTQYINDNCELGSESSLSWSGGEGHEGDDELTDWAPTQDTSIFMDQSAWTDSDSREFRAGCRRLGDERPGFSINTSANDRVAKFLQDTTKSELRLCGADRDKLSQLAALYSLELWFESPNSSLLKKTNRTPCMQQTQRHHSGCTAGHKRIRTQDHHFIM